VKPGVAKRVDMQPVSEKSPRPSLWRLFQVWAGIGIQSFGGGLVTLALVRTALVDQEHWITADEFNDSWALSRIAPGINLVALTILLGRRICGLAGSGVALAGLLLPSCAITVLMTAGYARYKHMHAVQAAVLGIIPAIAGVGLVNSVDMARPLFRPPSAGGIIGKTLIGLIMVASAVAMVSFHLSVVPILCGAGVVYSLYRWWRASRYEEQDVPDDVQEDDA